MHRHVHPIYIRQEKTYVQLILFCNVGEGVSPRDKADGFGGQTALHVAAKGGHPQVVKVLLQVGQTWLLY